MCWSGTAGRHAAPLPQRQQAAHVEVADAGQARRGDLGARRGRSRRGGRARRGTRGVQICIDGAHRGCFRWPLARLVAFNDPRDRP